jgi:hypothetical protein
MRPVYRGHTPQIGGIAKIVTNYKDWRQDLLDTIGNYCCYCNMVLNDSPQVEHVSPKNPQPGQPAGALLAWDNMLLACGPCNRAKGNKPNTIATHYMPDSSNTHMVFEYIIINHPKKKKHKACIPIAKAGPNLLPLKAQNTINLCKLTALTSNPRATDLRWKYRFEAWNSANLIWRTNWDQWGYNKANDFITLLLDAAISKGFFSIWFEAFYNVTDVKLALIDAFWGTDPDSFQNIPPFDPQPRNPTNLLDPI